jgi:hypothetical protein
MMRIKIILFLSIFIFVQNLAYGMESKEKLTRIAIASSDAIKYESKWLDNPPRLIIEFRTQNVFGKLVEDALLNEGVIKNITVDYYANAVPSLEKKQVKFLTFWLNQKTDYKVWDSGNKIFVDFKNPVLNLDPKQIEISSVISSIDINSKNKAADDLLAKVTNIYDAPTSNTAGSHAPRASDSKWLFAFLLIGVYILWFRPKEWKNLISKLAVYQKACFSSGSEHRKWWRHNLTPLKDKSVYIKIKSPETGTDIGFIPRDIGYGGLSFECNRLKKLKGKVNISIFTPGVISPVEVEGDIAWQKNSRNILRRQVGVTFANPPERDWARIHHYIEEQYAALKQ